MITDDANQEPNPAAAAAAAAATMRPSLTKARKHKPLPTYNTELPVDYAEAVP